MIERHPRVTVVLTSLVALVLSLVPLPHWAAILWPTFLVLVVLYWSTMLPRAGGMTLGFVGGLTLDAFHGSVLGEHALALSLVTYLAIRLNLLVRAKPLFEQSLFVFAALMAYEFLLWVIDGWSGYPLSTPTRWIPALTGSLIWPVIAGILGRFHTTR